MREVVIVSAVRTPIGSYGGKFKYVKAVDLGITALRTSIEKISLDPKLVDEVIFGNVLSAGLGQNISRQIAIGSELPENVASFTVNKVCGSGLKSIQLAAQSIMLGENDIVIAGGTESMSQAPYLSYDYRWGSRMGDRKFVDVMLRDGLTDAFSGVHMGVTAENIAKKYNISRLDQDLFALDSQRKAKEAILNNRFVSEITPVKVARSKGQFEYVDKDEYPRFDTSLEALSKLRPVFQKDGTVTAGNSSGLNDGAAALILMDSETADKLHIKPMAKIVAASSEGVSPNYMGLGPIASTKKVLEKAGWEIEDLELIEANEAFSSQSIAVVRELGLNMEKVNVNGGAIALGHPIGASGSRIVVTLLHEMIKRDAKKAMATLCIGGGQGISMLFERE